MYEVIRVAAFKWAAGEYLTRWGGAPIKPKAVYARASRHRSEAAARRAVERLNATYYPEQSQRTHGEKP